MIPEEIPGIGATSQRLRVNPRFDAVAAGIGPEEYFVLSRIDGATALREVLVTTGLPPQQAVQIAMRLRAVGALLLPGETAPPQAPAATRKTVTIPPAGSRAQSPSQAPTLSTPASGAGRREPRVDDGLDAPTNLRVQRTSPPPTKIAIPARNEPPRPLDTPRAPGAIAASIPPPSQASPHGTPAPPANAVLPQVAPPSRPRPAVEDAMTERRPLEGGGPVKLGDLDVSLPGATAIELAALAEPCDLPEGERRRLLAMIRLVPRQNPWLLLGLAPGASDKDVKRAYFRLSKEVHPDRYYGKNIGSFATRLATVFQAVTQAHVQLTSKKNAAPTPHAQVDQAQSPQEYARELFERACNAEIGGDAANAMKLFAAVVRLEPQLRYLKRAAHCALLAKQPRTALEYAKKAQSAAPEDPSCARLLATSFRALGQLDAAEEVLIMACAIKHENDVLAVELRNELADVRRAMAAKA